MMLTPNRLILVYLLLGLLWIPVGGVVLLRAFAADIPPLVAAISMGGAAFVIGSAAVIARLLQREQTGENDRWRALRQREDEFHSYFADNPRPMWRYDAASGRFLDVNDAALRQYGYTRDQFLQLTVYDIQPADDVDGLRAYLEETARKRTPNVRHERHRLHNGEFIHVEVQTYPVNFPDQPAIVAVIQDVTAQVIAERALQASESRYRAVSELISDYAYSFRVNADGSFEDEWVTADSFTRLTGYTWEDMDTIAPFVLFHPDEIPALRREQELLRNGQSVSRDYRIITKGGDERWLHIARRPQWDDQHRRIIRFFGIAQDITERKQYEERLEYQANILNHVSDAIISTDDTFRITSWNHAAEIIYGWTATEALGRTVQELIPPEYLEATTRPQVLEAFRSQGKWQGEVVQKHKDGTRIPILSSVTALRDASGRIIGSVAINRDITERKTAEEAAREHQSFQEAVADISTALTSTLDLPSVLDRILSNVGRVVTHDAANIMLIEGTDVRFASWHGYGPALDDFFRGQRLSIHKLGLAHMFTTGRPDLVERTDDFPNWNHLPGDPWVRSCLGVPIRTNDQVIGFLNLDSRVPGFFTARHAERLQLFAAHAAIALKNAKLYEEIQSHAANLERRIEERTVELSNALAKERELGQLKMRFVSMVSHEFRTPLAIIQSSKDLLKRYGDRYTPERRAEHFDEIQAQVWHMTDILEDFLTLSRAESGNLNFAPVDSELVSFVQAIIQELQQIHGNRTIRLDAAMPTMPARIDPRLARQAIMNLVSNAVKFSPPDTPVDIRLSTHDGGIMLKVQDEGMGISEDDQRHMFEIFHRGTNVGNVPGTGLGLAIVRRAVEAHGGAISVQSRVNQGTTVIVMLPLDLPRTPVSENAQM